MSYTKIIGRAWRMTWKHRSMWLFGFLLAFFSASGGGSAGRGVQYTTGSGDRVPGPWIVGVLVFAIVAGVALAVVGIILRYTSEGALIGMAREVEETGDTSVRSGWRTGWARCLRLFGVDLLIGIPTAAVVLILLGLGATPLLLLLAEKEALTVFAIVATILLELLAIAAIIVLATVLSLVRDLAYRQCVLGGSGAWASVREGWRLLREHARQVAGAWLVMLGIGLAVNIVAIPLAVFIAALAGGPALAIYSLTKQAAPAVVIGVLLGLVGAVLMAAVLSVYQTFRSAVWTLVYRDLVAPPQAL